MATHTRAEMRRDLAWLVLDQNRPSRADHYAMQTSMELRRIYNELFTKDRRGLALSTFKVEFKPWTADDEAEYQKMRNELIKAEALSRMTMPVTVIHGS